jgi:hypothetical protein
MAFGRIGASIALASVVRKPNHSCRPATRALFGTHRKFATYVPATYLESDNIRLVFVHSSVRTNWIDHFITIYQSIRWTIGGCGGSLGY